MPYIEGEDRYQIYLLPNTLDDFVEEENSVRVIDAYVDSLALEELGFSDVSEYQSRAKTLSPGGSSQALSLFLYERHPFLSQDGNRNEKKH
ncbi:hypothetical protein [Paenibacillus sp. RC343]|uniref:hypothetical protein n=1 Tax=Paenibacillus sp. RC343 TaxID=3045841 RepID=UPI0024BB9E67|nr:hypothetical protein [Paenibacillus sp. RC343]